MTLIPMTSSPKRILVTGFEPFDGDSVNPSSTLLDWLKLKNYDFDLATISLPVSFTSAYPLLKKAILEFNPNYVVLTGLAKNRVELTLERIAINWVDARIADNDGLILKSQKIKADSADGLFTTLPIEKMMEVSLASGCPTKISTSAGEYVCNHLLYLFLSQNKIPGGFIHLPGAKDYEVFYQGISSILQAL